MTNEFILQDRIQKIQQIIKKYGEQNFYISYSGGKDSNVISALIDMAIPDNKIPRVYVNTGIEYKVIVDFVNEKALYDNRFIIIQPKIPIRKMLDNVGYPFKSKEHSRWISDYQKNPNLISWKKYCDGTLWKKFKSRNCPNLLKYQFTDDFHLKVSDKCCHFLKEEPLKRFSDENKKRYAIIGIMASEGGRRNSTKCLTIKNGDLFSFQPLAPLNKKWEDWFISEYNVNLPFLYYPPYNFSRTGCKGCPFNPKLQQDLDILQSYFPNEFKQCEIIWKPVYEEYRRIGYRLRYVDKEQISFFD